MHLRHRTRAIGAALFVTLAALLPALLPAPARATVPALAIAVHPRRMADEVPLPPTDPQIHLQSGVQPQVVSFQVYNDADTVYSDGSPAYMYEITNISCQFTHSYQCPESTHSSHNGIASQGLSVNYGIGGVGGLNFGGQAVFSGMCCCIKTGTVVMTFDVIAFQQPPPNASPSWTPINVYFTASDSLPLTLNPSMSHSGNHGTIQWGIGVWSIP